MINKEQIEKNKISLHGVKNLPDSISVTLAAKITVHHDFAEICYCVAYLGKDNKIYILRLHREDTSGKELVPLLIKTYYEYSADNILIYGNDLLLDIVIKNIQENQKINISPIRQKTPTEVLAEPFFYMFQNNDIKFVGNNDIAEKFLTNGQNMCVGKEYMRVLSFAVNDLVEKENKRIRLS